MHIPPPPLTDTFLETLRAVARETLGRSTPEGQMLAAAVRDVSHYYTRDRTRVGRTGGDTAPLSARLRFFLPRDLYKVWSPLSELWALDALPRRAPIRMLDLGAGLGTTTLGVASFAAETGWTRTLEVTAGDQDPRALSVMTRLLPAAAANGGGLRCAPVRLTARGMDLAHPASADLPKRGFELVTAGLCLNELTAQEPDEPGRVARALTWLQEVFEYVADDGALIVLEPALRPESRLLQRVRDALQGDDPPHVFAPCPGVAHCPLLARERDWCHDLIRYDLPEPLAALARAAGLRTGDLTFSYLTLRRRPGTVAGIAGPKHSAFRVVGGPLRSKGKLEFDLCGDQAVQSRQSLQPVQAAPQIHRLQRLDRHRDRRHDVLATVQRGTLLGLQPDDCTADAGGKRFRLNPGRQPVVYEASDPQARDNDGTDHSP